MSDWEQCRAIDTAQSYTSRSSGFQWDEGAIAEVAGCPAFDIADTTTYQMRLRTKTTENSQTLSRRGRPRHTRRPLGLCLLLHVAGAARRRYVGRNIAPCGGVNPWRFRPYTVHVSNELEASVVVGQVKTRSTPFQLQFSRCLELCPKVQKISDQLAGSAMRGLHSGRPFCSLGCI